ncbi:head-tail adaptor protein [Firmicutes bacterium AM55-24TS]|jgi:SPP1 family predicted phage head-tail adaptor|nr:head-tail adaptor protein [Firmicutes bacterium AM55-24TS]RHP09327.1 head-tail adaptor protein [Firmicutes bacterium AF36-3BH]DAZ65778.1 MAG TPA: head tail joining protein [Caudoviricetes sp.]
MDFAKLRHKVVFLKPSTSEINEQLEQVIGWFPFHPVTKAASDDVYSTQDGEIRFKSGVLSGLNNVFANYGVRAYVSPATGREYDESQKIRAETTYNVVTRYFNGIESNMKILYGAKVFDIVSVLDINESHRELKIVCSEVDRYGKTE